ncbi:choline kinase [Halarcobacter mediterraneus]|uniref:Choline kinase n=1 Tax=Halarcobacter mediterraneus TaxID=2023153 RepID=A0A4V1M140_9BACT|nr:phosphotransferase [Halarcobacter mediterraneus]RXK12116.1 choline kinase [Halarcobacter mediterraneus]
MQKTKHQGLCNDVYKITNLENTYILRIFKKKHHLKINRKQEFKIQYKAYKKGLTARPIFLDKKNKFMIYEYINGIHKKKLNKTQIKNIAKRLKKLHKIKIKKRSYSFENEFNTYKKVLKDKISQKIIKKSLKLLKKTKTTKKDFVLCHNDLNQENIIFSEKILFIDWEFSKINNRFFDLATLCLKFKLNKKEEKLLLKHYFSNVKKLYYKKLKNYKKLCKNYWKLWFKVSF